MIPSEFPRMGNTTGNATARDKNARPRSSWNRTGLSAQRGESFVRNSQDRHAVNREGVAEVAAFQTTRIVSHGDRASIASAQDRLEKTEETVESPAIGEILGFSGEHGDPRAKILALYDEFRPRLFRYLRSMHLGHDQADEIIQETFMRLTTELLKAHQIENVSGWIVRVAHNLAIDLLKREQGPVLRSESAAFLIGNRIDPSLNPEDAYAEKEQSRRITNALSTLNPQHRQCFQMRAQGLRYRDIGIALGISEQRAAFVVKQAAVHLAAICG
jgi:RNA polymerase sigma-70 factor, ECF subfamily